MIPRAYIQAWSTSAPWPDLRQVEQDLIISRALCDLFNAPALQGSIAFRGGTAIHKLLFQRPLRYSEDIDLVQTRAEPIGATIDAIRDALSWLGKCNRAQAAKLTASLIEDIAPLLPTGVRYGEADAVEAFNAIWTRLIMRLKGEPWKSSAEAIAELRIKRFPGLLLNQ